MVDEEELGEMAKAMNRFIGFCGRNEECEKAPKRRKTAIIFQMFMYCMEDDGEENLWTRFPVIADKLLAISKVKITRTRGILIAGKTPANVYLIGELALVEYYEWLCSEKAKKNATIPKGSIKN